MCLCGWSVTGHTYIRTCTYICMIQDYVYMYIYVCVTPTLSQSLALALFSFCVLPPLSFLFTLSHTFTC